MKRFLAAGLLCASGGALCFVRAISVPLSQTEPNAAAVREERVVTIDSKTERWRLEWITPPKPVCSPEEECWQCCPCSGFAFGEYGKLDLVRTRDGAADERLSLGPLFQETEHPAADVPDVAVLRRWPVLEKDYEAPESPDLAAAVRARPIAQVMKIADYDHDGRASEFPFQIGTLPCGHQQTVLIGISRGDSTLHVFGTVAHPKKPLVLDSAGDWDGVLHSSGAISLTELRCGDHGSEEEVVVRLHATRRGITAVRLIYSCGSNFKRGRLISTEAF